MALRAPPITGFSLASLKSSPPSSSSSFTLNRPCMFMITPLRSSFLGNRGEALKVAELRLTYCDRIRCVGQGGGTIGPGMNLFARVRRIIKSYTHAILSFFEVPEKILEQAVLDMNDDLAMLRQATASVLATQKQLEVKYKDTEKASGYWYRKAQSALARGDEDLACEALGRRKIFVDYNILLKAQLDLQSDMADSIASKIRLLERKILEANLKKDALQARAIAAKATMKVQEMIGTVDTSSALSAFGLIEEKVLTMESRAEALHQLTTDHLEEKFKLLEGCSVEEEFAEIKRELSMSSKIGELPPVRDAIPLDSVIIMSRD